MKYYLVYENEIVGESDSPLYLPQGFEPVLSSLTLNVGDVYWDGSDVIAKPEKPGDRYFWNKTEWSPVDVKRPEVPEVPLMSMDEHELALNIYEHLATVDVTLAESLAYLLAKIHNDTEEMQLRKGKLMEIFKKDESGRSDTAAKRKANTA